MGTGATVISHGYSLWLVPTDEPLAALAAALASVAAAHGTPRFEPHVTLIGQLRQDQEAVWRATAALARHLRPFEVRLGEIVTSEQFFQAVVATVAQTGPVMAANRSAREALGRHDDPPYFPHLSLAYGKLSAALTATAEAAYATVRQRVFTVSSLQLVQTAGEVRDWKWLADLPFGG